MKASFRRENGLKPLRLENRTGKIISLGRVTLAAFIAVAVTFGVESVPAYPDAARAVSLLYLVLAALILPITWSNWWLEHWLKMPSHLLDVAFFVALDVSTGASASGPFFIFFVFLLLSAAAKWGWRGAVATAVIVTVLFTAETWPAVSGNSLDGDDYVRMIVRAGHLLVLSLMIGWFGMTHLAGRRQVEGSFPEVRAEDPPVALAVQHMAECLDAGTAALVWSDPDEPWLHIASRSRDGSIDTERLSPSTFPWLVPPKLEGRTFLFDVRRRRALSPRKRRLQTFAAIEPVNPALAAKLGLTEGIATPLTAETFHGLFLVGHVDGLCWDDLPVARKMALEIARAFDRSAALRAMSDSAADRTRLRVARDLHDSFTQVLAGLGLKLRGVRQTLSGEEGTAEELQQIERDLVRYQTYIHDFIDDLRNPGGRALPVELNAKLHQLAAELQAQWQVAIGFEGDHPVAVPRRLESEITHLLREAVANAVRHGAATRIALMVRVDDGTVLLRCSDNGRGFAEPGSFTEADMSMKGVGPRSLLERVRLLGGTVGLVSSDSGAVVSIQLPLRPPNP